MGRREAPIPDGPLHDFAQGLRDLRAQAPGHPTYRELAGVANFSQSVLSVAASGRSLPTWEVTLAYVRACGGDTEQWHEQWTRLHDTLRTTDPALLSEAGGDSPSSADPLPSSGAPLPAEVGAAPAGRRRIVVLLVAVAVVAVLAVVLVVRFTGDPAGYAAAYRNRHLVLPDYNYYVDLVAGEVVEGHGDWTMSTNAGGDGRGAFELPDDTTAYVPSPPRPTMTADECAQGATDHPTSTPLLDGDAILRFARVPPGTSFCLLSQRTHAVAVIRVTDTDSGNYGAKLDLDYYERS